MFSVLCKLIFSFIIASAVGAMMGIWDGRYWLGATIMLFILFSLTFRGSNKAKAKRM